jgi:hypothetical protein
VNGTPYWGNECFSELRGLSEIETCPLSISKINELCNSKGLTVHVSDMYSLFLSLAHLDFLFVIEANGTWVSWCRDVRFNYRDKFVFIPYYRYKTEQYELKHHFKDMSHIDLVDSDVANVRYDFEMDSITLDDRRIGFRADSVVLYNPESKVKYRLSIKEVPYFSPSEFSMEDLFTRYLTSAYIASDLHDFYWHKYSRIDNKFKNNREHLLRRKMGLKAYAHKYTELIYQFEAYLYCIFAVGVSPIEVEYKNQFDKLGNSLRFISYCKNDKCLVIKHYYKDNVTMRVKSYERYRRA